MTYPKFLYALRALQAVLAIGIISTLVLSNREPGYWESLAQRSAAAYVSGVVTLLVTLTLIVLQFQSYVFAVLWQTLPADVLCGLLWIISAVQLGLEPNENAAGKALHELSPEIFQWQPPKKQWYGGLAMCVIEIVLFGITGIVMFRTAKRV